MKNLAKFSVDRAITVFMAVIIVIVFGVVSYTNLTTDLFPSMNIPYSIVVTTYPGASPEEVEKVVVNPIESALATTTNVKAVTSVSQENFGMVILEFNSDTNMDSAVIEMRETLDMTMANMPEMVGSPMIIKLNPDMMPIMQMSVSKGELGQQALTLYVQEDVVPTLEKIPGVASVSVSGAYESEVQVVIDETTIAEKNAEITAINDQFKQVWVLQGFDIDEAPELPLLDKEMVSDILMAQNFEFPVGYANVGGVNVLVRVGDEFGSLSEIENLTVFTFAGMPNPAYNPATDPEAAMWMINPLDVVMNEITAIDYVNANNREYSKINGSDAISITIQKSSDFATTDVTNAIIEATKDLELLEDDADFTILLNQGDYIEQATGSVSTNLLYGAVLAVLVLIVFLRSARATFIVGISIPISLMFAIVLIYFTGITLNIVSLGGLALGIGMLVDNSIVVMENIFRMKKLGASNRDAAIQGTRQVSGAIFASTITTISVFVPVVFIEGFIKEIFMQMALTITYSLLASLVIALTLVPAISSKILKEETSDDGDSVKPESKVKVWYEKALKGALKFKFLILVLVVILFGGSIYLALSNGFEYFPASDEGQLNISITNPAELPISETEFFETLDSLSVDLLENDDVDVVGITLGSMQGSFMGFSSSDSASISVVLKDDRVNSTLENQAKFEELLEAEYQNISFSISGSQQQTEMLTGSGYQIELRGYDLEVLHEEANDLADLLGAVEGVAEVDNGIGIPAKEINIKVDKNKAIEYGYLTAVVMGKVAETLAMEEITTTISVDGDIYDVYVYDKYSNYSETEYTLDDIRDIPLGLSFTGDLITVGDVAVVTEEDGASSISHTDGIRSITIAATYEDGYNSTFVAQDIEEALEDYNAPEGYIYEVLGENEEIMEAVNTLALAILLAIALIYMIMASQFQSLTYPLIIMFTIPLAFTGGFLILYFSGMPVSVVAMIGFVILVGVVVNNGIVFVDYTNQLRADGLEVEEALIEAGKTRLRPIVMTALTTILALITMALGVGEGAEMMQPMAVTTIGGMLYATVLTLLVVPIMYLLLTKYAKNVLSILGIVVVIAGAGVGYYFLSLWYLILIGVVLVLALLANVIFNNKKVL